MKRKKHETSPDRLPRSSPDEILRLLIDPMHALALVTTGKVGEALASATRQIGELPENLVSADILIALAELDLRARQITPEVIARVHSTSASIEAAKTALEMAKRKHARAKAVVVLVAIGYHEKVKDLGFHVGIIEAP